MLSSYWSCKLYSAWIMESSGLTDIPPLSSSYIIIIIHGANKNVIQLYETPSSSGVRSWRGASEYLDSGSNCVWKQKGSGWGESSRLTSFCRRWCRLAAARPSARPPPPLLPHWASLKNLQTGMGWSMSMRSNHNKNQDVLRCYQPTRIIIITAHHTNGTGRPVQHACNRDRCWLSLAGGVSGCLSLRLGAAVAHAQGWQQDRRACIQQTQTCTIRGWTWEPRWWWAGTRCTWIPDCTHAAMMELNHQEDCFVLHCLCQPPHAWAK